MTSIPMHKPASACRAWSSSSSSSRCARLRCRSTRLTAVVRPVAQASRSADAPSEVSSTRRTLLGLSAGMMLTPLLLASTARQAAAEGAEITIEELTGGTATQAAPAVPAAGEQPAPGTPQQVTTPEGAIRLRTYDEATRNMTPTDKQIFSLNRRVQAQNRAPDDFPGFIREGFDITVVGEGYQMDADGLIYKDFVDGLGSQPGDGQQVVFDYTGYNESGAVIDSSYRKGRAAEVRLGISGLIPGFELGIKGMKPGGKRRIVVPPALGPPVGPSTFFSAKQCEVFDVELRAVKKCERRQMLMFSDVVCE